MLDVYVTNLGRCCHVKETIWSRYNGSFEVCSGVLLSPYNKGFLDLQLKFVSQANNGKLWDV